MSGCTRTPALPRTLALFCGSLLSPLALAVAADRRSSDLTLTPPS